jgi:hypothetical protein
MQKLHYRVNQMTYVKSNPSHANQKLFNIQFKIRCALIRTETWLYQAKYFTNQLLCSPIRPCFHEGRVSLALGSSLLFSLPLGHQKQELALVLGSPYLHGNKALRISSDPLNSRSFLNQIL